MFLCYFLVLNPKKSHPKTPAFFPRFAGGDEASPERSRSRSQVGSGRLRHGGLGGFCLWMGDQLFFFWQNKQLSFFPDFFDKINNSVLLFFWFFLTKKATQFVLFNENKSVFSCDVFVLWKQPVFCFYFNENKRCFLVTIVLWKQLFSFLFLCCRLFFSGWLWMVGIVGWPVFVCLNKQSEVVW